MLTLFLHASSRCLKAIVKFHLASWTCNSDFLNTAAPQIPLELLWCTTMLVHICPTAVRCILMVNEENKPMSMGDPETRACLPPLFEPRQAFCGR